MQEFVSEGKIEVSLKFPSLHLALQVYKETIIFGELSDDQGDPCMHTVPA